MFAPFFATLREGGVPVSLREYLDLLAAIDHGLARHDVEGFYYLARAALVKDERHFDRYDRAFAMAFKGLETLTVQQIVARLDLPAEWLRRLAEKHLSPEEQAEIAAMGGLEALMQALAERLATQDARHEGGSTWIGTAGTSPFGAFGYNPEGVRIGQDESRYRSAAKVWDRREFRDLDDRVELGTRSIKIALRRLRRWAREGAADELDLAATIRHTADRGWLDVVTRPERRNAVKVLLFLDVGGSMDPHVRLVEELFSAARSEFRHLEPWYFHNCVYQEVWRDNRRRRDARTPTAELLRTYAADWRAVFVGDAAMAPYELTEAGGASEHWNTESGETWLRRLLDAWPKAIWINPTPEPAWGHSRSTAMVRAIFEGRMYPLTLAGLEDGIRELAR
jgi:uncharacterized protein